VYWQRFFEAVGRSSARLDRTRFSVAPAARISSSPFMIAMRSDPGCWLASASTLTSPRKTSDPKLRLTSRCGGRGPVK
jgi:hypothetical protein